MGIEQFVHTFYCAILYMMSMAMEETMIVTVDNNSNSRQHKNKLIALLLQVAASRLEAAPASPLPK